MGRYRFLALLLALSLFLTVPAGALDSMTEVRDGLEGKTILVLGDSFTAGYGLVFREQDWSYVIAGARNMTLLDFSISGSSIGAGPRSLYPMVVRCLMLPEDVSPDIVLLQGGSNDFTKGIPLGEMGSWDPETFYGAVNLTISTLREKYPDALIAGFTPWAGDETRNREDQVQQDYVDAMLEIFGSLGLPCYDASNMDASGVRMPQDGFRSLYSLRPTDWYHLNALGHASFAPTFARWLEDTLYGAEYADQFYDLSDAPEDLRAAVSDLTGVMGGVSGHLFAPTRSATRLTLAVTLYRMAGRPFTPGRSFEDLEDAGTEGYLAASWAMDWGLFLPSDYFMPDQSITREMLSAVLCRYFTLVLQGDIDALTGLGAFPDGGDVSRYAVLPMGWALHAGVLSPRDGVLRPKAAVSRGQLAVALAAIRRLAREEQAKE